MRSRFYIILTLLAMQPIAVSTATAGGIDTCKTLEQVLERFIEAMGGREAIEKLTTRMCTGQLTTDFSSRTLPVYEQMSFDTYAKIPNKLLILYRTSKGEERNGFDGKTGWKQNSDGTIFDEQVGKSKLAWILNPQNALKVREYFPGLVMKPSEKIGDKTVYVLEPTGIPEEHYTLYFDTETGLLVRIGYYWDLLDYRQVDGVMFPFRIVTSRKGGSSTYVFDVMKHNLPIDDGMFVMPRLDER
ncbi:hypothetical protein KKG05_10095 [bacterium]|nr:hypothetical protein [bacterium]